MCTVGSISYHMHYILSFPFSTMVCHFTDIKYHQDPDDDSGVGPSISTDTKSTVFSEVSCYLP